MSASRAAPVARARMRAHGNRIRLEVQVSWEVPDGIKGQGRQQGQQEGSGNESQGEAEGQEGEEGRAESLSDSFARARAGTWKPQNPSHRRVHART